MRRIPCPKLGFLLVSMALFLWFSLAFVGSFGSVLIDFSFFVSATFIFMLGVSLFVGATSRLVMSLGFSSVLFYLPALWQRLNRQHGDELVGVVFDGVVLAIVVYASLLKTSPTARP